VGDVEYNGNKGIANVKVEITDSKKTASQIIEFIHV